MEELLGISTKGEFCDGPMQDVHWPEGLLDTFRVIHWEHFMPPNGRP